MQFGVDRRIGLPLGISHPSIQRMGGMEEEMRLLDRGFDGCNRVRPCRRSRLLAIRASISRQPQAVSSAGRTQAAAGLQSPAMPAPICQARNANAGSAAQKKTYTVPAGTKVLLQLRSSSIQEAPEPGDGVYLASTFPVVVGNRVMIPAGVYVQGVVDRVVRAGRVKGKAQLDMHFTSIIFPNGSVVEIPGVVNSLPGARNRK